MAGAVATRIGKVITPFVQGKMGTMDRASLIVRGGRLSYIGSAAWIIAIYYAGWRNERIAPGEGRFPFPGVEKLKEKFPVDRPDEDEGGGYSPQGASQFGGGGGGGQSGGSGGGGLDFGGGGGSWGGTKAVAEALADGLPLHVESTKRSTATTTSGNISDHYTGCKECYAIDLSGSVGAMDRSATIIIKRLGGTYNGKSTLEFTTTKNGYRIQILYRTMTGGNHFTHIHIGVRKVGYVP